MRPSENSQKNIYRMSMRSASAHKMGMRSATIHRAGMRFPRTHGIDMSSISPHRMAKGGSGGATTMHRIDIYSSLPNTG